MSRHRAVSLGSTPWMARATSSAPAQVRGSRSAGSVPWRTNSPAPTATSSRPWDRSHLTPHLKTKTDLKVGQSLSIPPVNAVLHIVTDHETIADISKRTDVPVKRIVDANNLEQATVYVGQWIIVPGAKSPPIPVAAPRPVAKP